jgi:hypothetical protein
VLPLFRAAVVWERVCGDFPISGVFNDLVVHAFLLNTQVSGLLSKF